MDFEKWIAEQSEDVQKAFAKHVGGLKSALDEERESSKTLKSQVKTLESKASEVEAAQVSLKTLQDQLDGMTSKDATTQQQLAEAQKALSDAQGELGKTSVQRDFYRNATTHGVTNLDDAYLIATGKGLIGDDGQLDWEKFRKDSGYLFQTPGTSPANPPRGKTLTMEEVRRMSSAEYEQNREAVNAVLAQSSR